MTHIAIVLKVLSIVLTHVFVPRYKGQVLSNPVPIDKVMKLVEDAVNEIKIDAW